MVPTQEANKGVFNITETSKKTKDKETLKEQATEVHYLLSSYVELHDIIFKKSATFLSLFKRVDFDDIYRQTEKLVSIFDKKRVELHSLKSSFNESTPSEYRHYFQQLLTFFERLNETVKLLKDRQYQLLLKSKGKKYSLKEYGEMENRYKELVERYVEEGQKLNSLKSLIFPEAEAKYLTMNFSDILTLLIGTAETKAKPSELIEGCGKFNMQQIEYFNINDDPLFEIGYNFVFKTISGEEARLEIIEIDGSLLQSGIQIIYKPRIFLQKREKDFSYIYNSLQSYYVNEQKQIIMGIQTYNFFNETSQCYISRSKANGRKVLSFRISNKETWTKYQ